MFEILIMLVIAWLHNLIKSNELYLPKRWVYMEIILQLDSNKSYFKRMRKTTSKYRIDTKTSTQFKYENNNSWQVQKLLHIM